MELKLVLFIFVSTVVATSVQSPQEYTSPVFKDPKKNSNWFKYGHKIYYVDTLFKTNFFKATLFCRHLGMHLLSINSQQEQDQVSKFIRSIGKSTDTFWTSGTDLAGNQEWSWLSTGQSMVYTNWHPGEPNKSRDSTEHCVEFRGDTGFTWNDLNCNLDLFFVCESIKDCANTDEGISKK